MNRAAPMKVNLVNSVSGRAMPAGWRSPMRDADGRKKLYQVVVETEAGPLRIGPAMIKDATGAFCEATAKAIVSGRVKGWGMPQIVCINQEA